MYHSELTALLTAQNRPRTLHRDELTGPDRTLALGYTCDRATWHVYLLDGLVHVLVYGAVARVVHHHEARVAWPVADLVPDKRLYPESTDGAFAQLLVNCGQQLRFTKFDEDRQARYAGVTLHGITHTAGWPLTTPVT
ncbi:hypothetical protein ACFVV7_34085 [Streptomyces globisporus]|uniref:hypothetical protein n=1 Tax=Streptomyces globisporus TaxID=1908 RepID=UPI0036DAAA55